MSTYGIDTSTTIPVRTPFVRDRSFIDTRSPPPEEFFDRVQDHIIAYFNAALGWRWSMAQENFESPDYPAGYVGDFRISVNLPVGGGLTLFPATGPDLTEQGEHGVRKFLSLGVPYDFEMQTADANIAGDFIYSVKIRNVNRGRLDPIAGGGLHVGLGPKSMHLPAFAGGGDKATWHIYARPTETNFPPAQYFDTGIPFVDAAWYELQICRFRGAVRWYINGALCRIVVNGETLGGLYLPSVFEGARRFLKTRRWAAGPANDGFWIDFYHCFQESS